jgi:hypothetical protein
MNYLGMISDSDEDLSGATHMGDIMGRIKNHTDSEINKFFYGNPNGLKYKENGKEETYTNDNHHHKLETVKNKYEELINKPKIIDAYNSIMDDNFNESNENDIKLSNTIIKFLMKIFFDLVHLDFNKVPDKDKISEYIKKIDFLLIKIQKICNKVKENKITYPELKKLNLTITEFIPGSLDEILY